MIAKLLVLVLAAAVFYGHPRWALLGAGNGPDAALWVSVGISVLILVSGLYYFRNMERTFADTI